MVNPAVAQLRFQVSSCSTAPVSRQPVDSAALIAGQCSPLPPSSSTRLLRRRLPPLPPLPPANPVSSLLWGPSIRPLRCHCRHLHRRCLATCPVNPTFVTTPQPGCPPTHLLLPTSSVGLPLLHLWRLAISRQSQSAAALAATAAPRPASSPIGPPAP